MIDDDEDPQWKHPSEGQTTLTIALVVMCALLAFMLSCGPRPRDQANRPSVSSAQHVYRVLFPLIEGLVLWGLDQIRPADPAPAYDGAEAEAEE
jgi:hypothetical protein